ncbi:MAG: response regulator [Candidatus Zixiibacteriota bacterium]
MPGTANAVPTTCRRRIDVTGKRGKVMQNPKILIVDDEENILHSLKRLFRKEEYDILTAKSGAEGLKILDSHDMDLIISDLKMPIMNGVEFLAQAKERNPDALRIMLTGHADVKAMMDAIDQGEVYRFLLKPWNDDELRITIKQALEFYYVQKENKSLIRTVKRQNQILDDLEREHPGISNVRKDEDGTIVLSVEGTTQKRQPE